MSNSTKHWTDGAVEGEASGESMSRGYDDGNAPTDQGGDRITDCGDVIFGNGGDDTISGGKGDDTIFGNAGDDTISGGKGNDEIYGDDGGLTSPIHVTVFKSYGSSADFNNGLFIYVFDPATGTVLEEIDLTDNVKCNVGDTFEVSVPTGATVGLGIRSPEGDFYSSGYGANAGLNPDGEVHTRLISQDGVNGPVSLGFEDLYGLGDQDFEDVEVKIDLAQSGATFDNAHVSYSSDAGAVAAGDDVLLGGAGDDVLHGEDGNDTIFGDNGDAGETVREIFQWSDESGFAYEKSTTGFTQDTGSASITFDVESASAGVTNEFHREYQNTDDLDAEVGNKSSFQSVLNGSSNSAVYSWTSDQPLEDVEFRINDIDGSGQVKVLAYDADGNPIEVVLSDAGSDVGLSDTDSIAGNDTATSLNDGYAPNSDAAHSVLVTIPGPVSRWEILHDQLGNANSGITVTDIAFTTVSEGSADGNDTLYGGAGDDILDGEAGADMVFGGDDADTIIGGAGDTVDGGAGGNDYDVLDLTGMGPFVIDGLTPDSNGNGFDGTIVFVDESGTPTGETIVFTEIESIQGDNRGDAPPFANDDTAVTDEDTAVVIDVLANDFDGDGQALTVTEASSPNGTVDINADGTLTFTPAPDYNGPATITYTVADPDGNEDFGTVYVTVNPVNDAPVAMDDFATTTDAPVMIPVLDNDTDVDGDALTIIAATSPNGTVDINADGTLTFTPTEGFEGDATINYTVADPDGLMDDAVVTVEVTGPPLDGIVEGTAGNDLIDVDYTGDPEGDRVDNNDAILPGEGPNDDIILGFAGDDTIIAGEGDDEVDGGIGNDTITTGAGSDEVQGGAGDDVINTGNGSFLIDKGYPGVFTGEEGTPGIYDDRDTVYGGDGNDTIRTGDDEDFIDGGDGNDVIDGGIDDDTIHGGSGDDRIVGGEGEDTIYAGDGDDTIYAGNDPVLGLDQFNIEDDGSNPLGPDLRPDNGRDTVYGGAGNDTIYGADDDDALYGEAGDDYIDGEIDDDLIDGGIGNDTLLGGQGDDVILGGDGNDSIDGGTGNDTLSGGADRDTFTNVNAGDTVDGGGAGDDYDILDLTGSTDPNGSLEVTFTGPDANGNGFDGFVTYFDQNGASTGTLTFTDVEEVIPCFTPGTLIATPQGERRVEELSVGDRVITRDNGIQRIRWVGSRALSGADLASARHLRPVMIRAGALGGGLPERDMLVSPNHRVLVANQKTELFFEESEVLVAAKHLTALEGVEIVDVADVEYIHIMFDQHEVILSDGAWTESFQPGDMTLGAMGAEQRDEIFELFPELKTREGMGSYASARRSLKKHEALLVTM
ncbi:Hint domain-containing protein [Aliishimia ponticola]|nr:Hint domain-containing protein [Aliishimia ponticola]